MRESIAAAVVNFRNAATFEDHVVEIVEFGLDVWERKITFSPHFVRVSRRIQRILRHLGLLQEGRQDDFRMV